MASIGRTHASHFHGFSSGEAACGGNWKGGVKNEVGAGVGLVQEYGAHRYKPNDVREEGSDGNLGRQWKSEGKE